MSYAMIRIALFLCITIVLHMPNATRMAIQIQTISNSAVDEENDP